MALCRCAVKQFETSRVGTTLSLPHALLRNSGSPLCHLEVTKAPPSKLVRSSSKLRSGLYPSFPFSRPFLTVSTLFFLFHQLLSLRDSGSSFFPGKRGYVSAFPSPHWGRDVDRYIFLFPRGGRVFSFPRSRYGFFFWQRHPLLPNVPPRFRRLPFVPLGSDLTKIRSFPPFSRCPLA